MSPTRPTAKLIPHLVCRDASNAVGFYQRALGAEPQMLLHAPDGKLMHGCLQINGTEVFIGDTCGVHEAPAPLPPGAPQVCLHLQVDDCDAVFQRAVDVGCTPTMQPEDMFWGDRYGMFQDPYGHTWSVATQQRVLSRDELETAMAQAMEAHPA